MQTQLEALKSAIAGETIQTPDLSVARGLFDQLVVRLFHHQANAKIIADKQAADKAAQVAAAAKIVEEAEAEKLAAAKKLEQESAPQGEAAPTPNL